MSTKLKKMQEKRKVLIKDLNPVLVCSLCEGYLVDATVLADCLHVFCRGCIIKYFDNYRTACPNCNILYKKKNQICFRPDPQLQSLVYKLVPNLYSREMQTREDFYRSTGFRASSSCSDDSVIDKERDSLKDQEAWINTNIGDKTEFFSAEDMISLSIEYYQQHLDETTINKKETEEVENKEDIKKIENNETHQKEENKSLLKSCVKKEVENNEKRYLKCPAAVTMQLLQKFLRMKFGLTADHKVDIIYKGEVLPNSFTLIDVAYTFKWTRTKPMRFFYRIFTPLKKIKPIKIINTSSSSGSKQLQIVPLDNKIEKQTITEKKDETNTLIINEDNESLNKERLMANLQLQKIQQDQKSKINNREIEKETCVYEYVEPDKEELKRFAERRDREWAMQKKQDEKNNEHYFSKKRKKSKHSKNESVHKKRKLHAEITSNEEEDLKLKVKLTSHKHKHHKSSEKNQEMSAKEKLLQMRQVRHHKHNNLQQNISNEDKTTVVNLNTITNAKQIIAEKLKKIPMVVEETVKKEDEKEKKIIEKKDSLDIVATSTTSNNNNNINKKEEEKQPLVIVVPKKEEKKPIVVTFNRDVKKEWGNNKTVVVPSVKIERIEEDKQKTFLKSFQNYTEKYQIKQQNNTVQTKRPLTPLEKQINSIQKHCTIEAKRSGNATGSKIEDSGGVKNKYPTGFTVSKVQSGGGMMVKNSGGEERPPLEITLIPPSSAQTVKNRLGSHLSTEKNPLKRPMPSTIPLEKIKRSVSLKSNDITIIPKTPDSVRDNVGALDLSNKSPESPKKTLTSLTHTVTKSINNNNGLNNVLIANRQLLNSSNNITSKIVDKQGHQLSNLQMLSKVASEHPILKSEIQFSRPSRPIANQNNVSTTSSNGSTTLPKCNNNLAKLPKLTEIKSSNNGHHQFKMANSSSNSSSGGAAVVLQSNNNQMRAPASRPNQNQNIRNIPNPSLLVRQQNQNRLNSLSVNVVEKETNVGSNNSGSSSSSSGGTNINNNNGGNNGVVLTPSVVKVNNIVEKKEIPV